MLNNNHSLNRLISAFLNFDHISKHQSLDILSAVFSGTNALVIDFANEGYDIKKHYGVMVMVYNATFNNVSVISWRSVLSVEETGVP